MTRYAKTMSQALAEVQMRELKMNDPKLIKVFDKLKPRDTIKLKVSSSIAKGKDFQPYTVRSKNTLRNGVEKITMILQGNPTGVKRFLYKRDGKVTFAIGDMGASIDDIKEEVIHELVIEEVATEMAYKPGSFKDTRPQEKTAKALDALIKDGGLDKKDFQKARQLYVQASDAASREKLKKYIYNLDTSPTEALMDIIGRNDPDTFMKMYPNSKEGELLSRISYAHRNVKAEEFESNLDESKVEIGLDEMNMTHVLINMQGKVQGYTSNEKDAKEMARRTKSTMHPIKKKISDKTLEKMNALAKTPKELKDLGIIEEVELDEKYDLYHKTFSDAMQHAYDYAKKKMGITVDPKEIDDKVATGPKKPSVGDTNKYRLKGRGGNLQIQVYNKGGSKPFELNMYKEDLDKEDEPKVKEIIKKLKGASQAHAGQAKDLEKAIAEKFSAKEIKMAIGIAADKRYARGNYTGAVNAIEKIKKGLSDHPQVAAVLKRLNTGYEPDMTKGNDMTEKLTDGNLSLKETVLKMWQEAKSPEQQAAIAIAKKEKEKKEEPDEGNLFTKALKDAKDKGEKTFTVSGKTYDVKTEKLVGGQKELDKDKDGDIDGKDFALLRKAKKEEVEFTRYHETKQGSLRESILKMWGEINEKVEYVEYKFKNERDAKAAKAYFDGIQIMSFDVNDDNVRGGELSVDAGKKDMTKYHKEVMKKFRPKVMTQEKKDLTKNEKDDKKNMTDTGKEMTPVDMAPKMPKIKNEKNKV